MLIGLDRQQCIVDESACYNLLLDAVYVRRLQRSLSVARDDDDDDDGGGGDGGGDAEGAEDCDSENITVPLYSRAALRQVSHTEWHVDSWMYVSIMSHICSCVT